jgi:hypothetical protein
VGLRLTALVIVALCLVACSATSQGPTASSSRIAAPAQAADLRTHLDLLFGEHVMIVTKVTISASTETQTLIPYARLLDVNANDLALEIRRAFGNRSAEEFYQAWGNVNRDLLEYGTGLVVHDQNMADKFSSHLSSVTVPAFSQFLSNLAGLNLDQQISAQANATKTVIEDAAGQSYQKMYDDLRGASGLSAALGDALARRMMQKFPDKFPGDSSTQLVDLRVKVSGLLQQHAYLSTMASDAGINARSADKVGATAALATNVEAIAVALHKGDAAFKQVWADRVLALDAYATGGDAAPRRALSETFVQQLSSRTGIPSGSIADQANATIRVIDDQRAKSFDSLAGDDRSAATAMQPVADALVQS